jgi:phosphodiesterase/alkaline phosphatase D-like protein
LLATGSLALALATFPQAGAAGGLGFSLTPFDMRMPATHADATANGSYETFKALPQAGLPPTVVTEPATSVTGESALLHASVNPNGSEVTECTFEYGTTTGYGSHQPCSSLPGSGESPVAVSLSLKGLAVNTTYHFRISATNAGGTSKGLDQSFKTLPNAPTVVTGVASSITSTSATLNATVNPERGEVSECKFEYGTTTSYGSSASCSSLPGSGESPVGVSATVNGLVAKTTYHFRISATNPGGTSKGSDQTFTTVASPPAVVTGSASSVKQTSATLHATVNPNGGEVSVCKFEYGTTTSYGSSAPCSTLPGSGESPVGVSASAKGLVANTSYHFRISATNPGGTSKGSDETFKTQEGKAPTVVTEAASSVTQTSASLTATVNPNEGEVSECKFEYGTTTSYGSSAPCSSLPGSGESPVGVSASVKGLVANITYHFRISATNLAGTSKGSDGTFKTQEVTAPTAVTTSATAVTQATATLNARVNPNGAEVTECKFEYGTTTSYGSSASCSTLPGSEGSPVEVSASVTGLSANTTYHFRISATNARGTSKGSDQLFKTLPNAPTVVTEPASSVTQESATLHASVNPNGGEVSECKFEYGTTTAYGSSTACSPSPGSGESPVAVSLSLKGLAANTSYHFRISATNAGGTSKGSDQTFTTLVLAPGVVTKSASSITDTSATLNATVNPNGHEVSECKFEYGTTTSYGSSAPCSPAPGSGSTPVAVSAPATPLVPNTTYHFRISATNPGGTSQGSDEAFNTLPRPPTVLTAAASSITQTSATLNATVNPEGREVSECKFEWGTTTAYGSSTACSPSPGSGTSPVAVSASLTGLSNKTTYHFRISATNSEGQSKGSDRSFTAATPHVYRNGVRAAEGKPLRTISWGTLKLTNPSLGEVECHDVAAGFAENPGGGGTAVGKVQGFVPYECVSESCKALGGSATQVGAEELPWSTEATEVEAGGFRMRIGNGVKAAGAAFLRINCVGVKNTQFSGEGAPRVINNGFSMGSGPGEEEFDQPGSGELESEALGGLKIAGKLKTQGYSAEELIEVRNP